MRCQDCQELFSLYLDGEIDQISRSRVDSHFDICPQCKMEWQAFKNSIEFLRNMPMASVPPDFLAGIHQKLEPRPASLIQLIPVSQTDRVAENSISTEQSSLLLAENEGGKGSQQDFYPGVPLLSQYEGKNSPAMQQFAMIPRSTTDQHIPAVDFVSTGSGHTSSPYLDTPLTSFSSQQQAPTIKPDLQITIHSAPRAEQMAIVQQIVQSPLWRSELYNHNTLLLSVPASSFDQLLQICCSEKTSFSPEYARNSHYISLKRFITVAIKLD
jgi:hypothetical protein